MEVDLLESAWRRAGKDFRQMFGTVRFWMAESVTAVILAILAVSFYPKDASNLEQTAITGATVIAGTAVLSLLEFLTIWVAIAPRHQRNDARNEIEHIRIQRQWLETIDAIFDYVQEGDSVLERSGRPGFIHSDDGLKFMNEWVPKVTSELPPEYRVDFLQYPRSVLQVDDGQNAVWANQLDLQLERLRKVCVTTRPERSRTR